MNLAQAQNLESHTFVTTYARTPLFLTRGAGMYVWDDQDRRYLDFCSGGRAVNALGHCHPRVVAALRAQAEVLIHTSNDYYTEPQFALAELLTAQFPGSRALFCNSGAEANEAAIKLARKHGKTLSAERVEFVSALNSFHGRTMGALTATGQAKYREAFAPMVPGFSYVPYNDLAAMDAAITDRTCGVLLEPVLGESGVYPATPEYLAGVRRLCDERGALLILDEVQTGLGRTGKLFAFQHYGIEPDVLTLSKALGGGVPIGAMLAKAQVAPALTYGDHGTTFGGSPIAAAAALAALSAILEEGLVENAARIGAVLHEEFTALQATTPLVTGVRACGCMVGVDLAEPIAAAVKQQAQELGLLILTVGDRLLRLLPALICTPDEARTAVRIIAQAIHDVALAPSR